MQKVVNMKQTKQHKEPTAHKSNRASKRWETEAQIERMTNAAKSKRRIMTGKQHTMSRGGQGAEKRNSDNGDAEARSNKTEATRKVKRRPRSEEEPQAEAQPQVSKVIKCGKPAGSRGNRNHRTTS